MPDLPNCPCGANQWTGGGGQFGPRLQAYNRTCDAASCINLLNFIEREGWAVITIGPRSTHEGLIQYMNTTMAVQARAYKAKWDPIMKAAEGARYDALCREWGLDPEKGVNYNYRDDLPKDDKGFLQFDYRNDEGVTLEVDAPAFRAACRVMWDSNLNNPNAVVRPPDPIDLPEDATAYVYRGLGWDLVEPSADAEMPKDPLRVGHDAYFEEVFNAVQAATGQSFTPERIPNKYYRDLTNSEPWYEFTVGSASFMVGPRKRVINITFSATKPFNTEAMDTLGKMAETDKVTFSARDDQVTIHAWTKAKTIEYLTTALQAAA